MGRQEQGSLSPEAIIAQFQEGRRQFQSHWYRVCFFHLFPSFILFILASQFTTSAPLTIGCFAVFAFGIIRGFRLAAEFRRCPVCGRVQLPAVVTPYRRCRTCRTRLSHGVKDSW